MSLNKNIINTLCIMFLISLLAACNQDDKKIAIVDAEQIYQKSNLASAGMKHLETLTEQMQTTLMQMQEQIKAAPEDKELEQRLQTQLFSMQGAMDTAQRAVAERVNKHFEEAVETYRKQQNLELVLPKQLVIAVRPDADITQKVIDIMNTKTADFSDITLAQETNAPAANLPGSGAEAPKVSPEGGKTE